jgi:hypothetical protein
MRGWISKRIWFGEPPQSHTVDISVYVSDICLFNCIVYFSFYVVFFLCFFFYYLVGRVGSVQEYSPRVGMRVEKAEMEIWERDRLLGGGWEGVLVGRCKGGGDTRIPPAR